MGRRRIHDVNCPKGWEASASLFESSRSGDLGGCSPSQLVMADPKEKLKTNAVSEKDLRQEVAALASQLGLAASTGEETGFDDTDFRPPSRPARVRETAITIKGKTSAHEARPAAARPGQPAAGRAVKGPQPSAADPPKSEPARCWNSGVGPRPGTAEATGIVTPVELGHGFQ